MRTHHARVGSEKSIDFDSCASRFVNAKKGVELSSDELPLRLRRAKGCLVGRANSRRQHRTYGLHRRLRAAIKHHGRVLST